MAFWFSFTGRNQKRDIRQRIIDKVRYPFKLCYVIGLSKDKTWVSLRTQKYQKEEQ
jgi:hypothetical protein